MSVILMVVTAVAALAIDHFGRGTSGAQAVAGRTISVRYCDLLVASHDESTEPDWECLAASNDEVQLAQNAARGTCPTRPPRAPERVSSSSGTPAATGTKCAGRTPGASAPR
jgi:hypothetical protein